MNLPPEIQSMIGIHLLFSRIESLADTVNVDPPLSKTERRILIHLGDPMRMGVLAERIFCLPSSVTATADDMEEKGLLVRRQDPDDRRAWLLELTPEGQAVREKIIELAVRLFRETTGLAPDEILQFAGLVGKIRQKILMTGVPEELKE